MDASTTIERTIATATDGESGCGQPPMGGVIGPYWTTARTFSFCHRCGKPVNAGNRVLRFAQTGFQYCLRATCGELEWIAFMEDEAEARDREDWSRRHPVARPLALPVE